jgi:hypothetical protein
LLALPSIKITRTISRWARLKKCPTFLSTITHHLLKNWPALALDLP